MTEIRKLNKEDMSELLDLLNQTFGHKYGRPMYFDKEQPKMWIGDDLHMERHIAVFEDGKMAAVVGVYPLHTVIGGEEFLFFTTGNVATLPQYEGKGYFSKIFPLAIEEAKRQGADGARLGGARQRYARYGFESCGPAYEFILTAHNAKHVDKESEAFTLEEISREDTEALAYCHALMEKKPMFVRRDTSEGFRDMYLAMCSKEALPYLIKKNGRRIGYLCAKNGFGTVLEFSMENERDIVPAALAAAKASKYGQTHITVSPLMPHAIAALQAVAQEIALVYPSRFNFFSLERLVNRLLQMAAELSPLPVFDFSLKIEGGETLLLHSGKDGCYCKKAEGECDLTLSHLEASRLLFGMNAKDLLVSLPDEKQIALRATLPLPFTWATNDFV